VSVRTFERVHVCVCVCGGGGCIDRQKTNSTSTSQHQRPCRPCLVSMDGLCVEGLPALHPLRVTTSMRPRFGHVPLQLTAGPLTPALPACFIHHSPWLGTPTTPQCPPKPNELRSISGHAQPPSDTPMAIQPSPPSQTFSDDGPQHPHQCIFGGTGEIYAEECHTPPWCCSIGTATAQTPPLEPVPYVGRESHCEMWGVANDGGSER
jgi:hypothetical protein